MAVDPRATAARGDEWTKRLTRLFREHPAWVTAARYLTRDATSTVYFSHREADPWRLEQREGRTRLLPGAAADPDFVFRFHPVAIERLEDIDGDIGQFAVGLFTLIGEGAVDLRIAAGFGRLMRRGYVKLVLVAGPPVVAYGAAHGIRSIGALRRLVSQQRASGPADWELPRD
jgi:hypothetical protein